MAIYRWFQNLCSRQEHGVGRRKNVAYMGGVYSVFGTGPPDTDRGRSQHRNLSAFGGLGVRWGFETTSNHKGRRQSLLCLRSCQL